MKKQIWKYELKIKDTQSIEMPKGSEILTVQTQQGIPCLWALVDPESESEIRTIELFGTGHPIYYDMGISRNYIGTFQMEEGRIVFHAFEYTGI